MEPLINCFKLLSFIYLKAEVPEVMIKSEYGKESVINPSYNTCRKKDQLLKTWILSLLLLVVLPQTLGLSTLSKVWEELRVAYGAPNEARLTKLNI